MSTTRCHRSLVAPFVLATSLATAACDRTRPPAPAAQPIVGAWLVTDANAPFPHHLYVFNADGTMHQANPDAGDPRTSDSDGKGAWVAQGDRIRAHWVELLADRSSHKYAGRLEVRMELAVSGDSLSATEVVSVFDASGAPLPAPATPKTLAGARIVAR